MQQQLHTLKCRACEGLEDKLKPEDIQTYLPMTRDWQLLPDDKMQKEFKFKNFRQVMAFVNRIADIAEEEGHHPNLFVHDWNKLTVTLSTYAVKGLSINDFILASKIDRIE